MTKEVISVRPDAKVADVADLMTKSRIHGVPVVDEDGLVKGIITESDFFIKDLPDFHLPSYINFLKNIKIADKIPRQEKKQVDRLLDAKAKDIMSKECVTVTPNVELSELIRLYKQEHLFTLPVVNKEGKIIGVVTRADIIQLLNNFIINH